MLEVVNLGVSGYGTDQEYLLWRQEGVKWSPDIVLLFITLSNDMPEVGSNIAHNYPKPYFRLDSYGEPILMNIPVPRKPEWTEETEEVKVSNTRRILSYSVLANIVVGEAIKNKALRELFISWGIVPPRSLMLRSVWDYRIYMSEPALIEQMGWDILLSLVGKINKSVNEHGAQFKVVLIPSMHQVYPELWSRFISQPAVPQGIKLDLQAPINRVEEACKKMGIEVINLLPDLKEAGRKDPYLYFPLNRHWTKQGHRVVAETIKRSLK